MIGLAHATHRPVFLQDLQKRVLIPLWSCSHHAATESWGKRNPAPLHRRNTDVQTRQIHYYPQTTRSARPLICRKHIIRMCYDASTTTFCTDRIKRFCLSMWGERRVRFSRSHPAWSVVFAERLPLAGCISKNYKNHATPPWHSLYARTALEQLTSSDPCLLISTRHVDL